MNRLFPTFSKNKSNFLLIIFVFLAINVLDTFYFNELVAGIGLGVIAAIAVSYKKDFIKKNEKSLKISPHFYELSAMAILASFFFLPLFEYDLFVGLVYLAMILFVGISHFESIFHELKKKDIIFYSISALLLSCAALFLSYLILESEILLFEFILALSVGLTLGAWLLSFVEKGVKKIITPIVCVILFLILGYYTWSNTNTIDIYRFDGPYDIELGYGEYYLSDDYEKLDFGDCLRDESGNKSDYCIVEGQVFFKDYSEHGLLISSNDNIYLVDDSNGALAIIDGVLFAYGQRVGAVDSDSVDITGFYDDQIFFSTPESLYTISYGTELFDLGRFADRETFEVLGGGYFKDENHVYTQLRIGELLVSNYDPDSFKIINPSPEDLDYSRHIYTIDKAGVYFNNKKLPNADPNTFTLITTGLGSVYGSGTVQYGMDATNVYFEDKLLEADRATFEVVVNGHFYHEYAKDAYSVFYRDLPIFGANPSEFTVLKEQFYEGCGLGAFSKDGTNVYFENKIVKGADPRTFEIILEDYGKDLNNVYWQDKVQPQYDVNTFTKECPFG